MTRSPENSSPEKSSSENSSPDIQPARRRVTLRRVVLIGILVICATAAALRIFDDLRRRRLEALNQGYSMAPRGALADGFKPVQVVPQFPPVSGFQIVDAKTADDVLQGDELVLAVEINGQARAYPINMLTGPAREIINDQLAGTAIAATW